MLARLFPADAAALTAQGISLDFAELKDPVRRKIERYGLTRTIDPHHFFPTVGAAVAAFRDETGAQWTAAVKRGPGEPAPGVGTTGPAAPGQTAANTGPPRDSPASPTFG